MTDLDHRLREYYSGQCMDSSRVETLVLAARPRRWRAPLLAAVGLCVMAAVTLAVILQGTDDATQLMVREASLNHRSKLEMEFNTNSISGLHQQMDRLPFAIALPQQLSDGLSVVGARYCTIAGSLAAHVRLQPDAVAAASADQRSMSLFMTEAASVPAELGRLGRYARSPLDAHRAVLQEGVAVAAWEEDGLLYVLAGDSPGGTQVPQALNAGGTREN